MSSLLVALIPGLLMLATFGLDRVESSLLRDAISATDVAEFLNQAGADDVDMLARDGMNDALHRPQRDPSERDSATGGLVYLPSVPDLPTHEYFPSRQYFDDGVNPEFQQTRHANRV